MSKPKIMLDAGHGGHDSGAVGPNGLREKDVALAVVLMLGAMLEDDYAVFYTRRKDEFLTLSRRASLANAAGVHAFLSVHCNAGPPGKGEGFEVFTSHGQTTSDRFATDLFLPYAAAFPEKMKRMDLGDGDEDKEARFTVLTQTNMRAALFELEFIHTAKGEAWLGDPVNQERCARALAAGFRRHYQIEDQRVGETPTLLEARLPGVPDRVLAEVPPALNAGQIFNLLSRAPDLEAAVAALPLDQWRAVYAYLRPNFSETGITGDVLGMLLVDGAKRLNEGRLS